MSDLLQWTIVFGCAVLGYCIVHIVLQKSQAAKSKPEHDPTPRRAQQTAAWYEVLKVAPSASADEIKAAYRKQMEQYHPDRVAHLGEELRNLAEDRTKEINAAYDQALTGC